MSPERFSAGESGTDPLRVARQTLRSWDRGWGSRTQDYGVSEMLRSWRSLAQRRFEWRSRRYGHGDRGRAMASHLLRDRPLHTASREDEEPGLCLLTAAMVWASISAMLVAGSHGTETLRSRDVSRVGRDWTGKDWMMLHKSNSDCRHLLHPILQRRQSGPRPACVPRSDEGESALTTTCASAAHRRLYQARHKMPPMPSSQDLQS